MENFIYRPIIADGHMELSQQQLDWLLAGLNYRLKSSLTYNRQKKAKDRLKLPASLPYVEKIHDIPES